MHHAYIDKFANLDSPVHKIDPRAKIIATLFFITIVISVPRYEVFTLVPFVLYPAALLLFSGVPVGYVLKHAIFVSPFILSLAIFTPVFDRQVMGELWGITITGGMLTCCNIVIKFFLTVTATLVLSSTTRFDYLLKGIDSLGIPRVIVLQLSFLYRYLFLLVDEAQRLKMARDARNFHKGRLSLRLKAVGGVIGILFLKTLNRGERVYAAMASRGFDGRIRIGSGLAFHIKDAIYIGVSVVFITGIRFLGVMGV